MSRLVKRSTTKVKKISDAVNVLSDQAYATLISKLISSITEREVKCSVEDLRENRDMLTREN